MLDEEKVENALKELIELHPVVPKVVGENQMKNESDSADDDLNNEKLKKGKKKGKKVVKKKKKVQKKENHTEFLIYYDKITIVHAGESKNNIEPNEKP